MVFDAAASILVNCVLAWGHAMIFNELGEVEEILRNRACWSVGLRLSNADKGLNLDNSFRSSVSVVV